jgi:penicillin-binding protein 1A
MSNFNTTQNTSLIDGKWSSRIEKHTTWIGWLRRIFLGGCAFFLLTVILFWFMTPSFKTLEDPSLNIASEVIAGDDTTVLGRLYIQNRAPVRYENIPKHVVKALLAIEDSRFYEHSGVDPEALARVLFKTFLMGQSGQGGGSTLSMQTAKLLYSDRNLKNKNAISKAILYYYYKLSEMITAIKLERAYTKEEIITMYLNTYDFGYNAHGIRAASEVYFAKAPEQLTFEEGATLVGMCNNSNLYNPIKRNEKTRIRRNLVLERCYEQNILTKKQYNELSNKSLDITKFKNRTHNDGLATYFRSTLADTVKNLLKTIGITKPDGSYYDVYRDGLKIYTTIDPEMQRLAEESMFEHMKSLQAKYFQIWKGKNPWTYRDADDTDEKIKLRLGNLDAQIRNSERYAFFRSLYLDKAVDVVEEDYNELVLSDTDIINMLRQERDAKNFDNLLKIGVSAKRIGIYRGIMGRKYWVTLKKQWNTLQTIVKTEFSKPVKMKVFAYNAAGEKDTTMTPLDSIRYHRMHLQIGSLGVDPTNGYVKFWVGGIGHKYFQVDHTRLDRQVGSTFKPFVYATAIFNGISPCTNVPDVAQTIGVGEGEFGLTQSWTPKNATGYSGSYMTLWDALKESRNTASVYLMKRLGSTQPVREIVREMGIDVDAKRTNGTLRVPKSPSICLGSADLSVHEMTGAFTTFSNNGVVIKPLYIRKITDKSGKILYTGMPQKRNALPENVAYVMQQMLKYNVRSAKGIKELKSEIGGKTGTTNDFRDGWFMGITPNLVVGTWAGGEDQWIRFLRIDEGQGSYMARPFFSKVMTKIEKSTNIPSFNVEKRFTKLVGNIGITINCGDYYDNGETKSGGGTDEEGGGNTEGVEPQQPVSRDQFQDETEQKPLPNGTGNSTTAITKPKATTMPKPSKPQAADEGF